MTLSPFPVSTALPPGIARGPLLDSLQTQLVANVSPVLERTLAGADDYLFNRSQAGEEMLGLIALRELRQMREPTTQRFMQAIADGFAALARDPAQPQAPGFARLSLLEDDALEERLAVEQLAASVLRTHAPSFEAAARRLSVLVGRDLGEHDNPLSPHFLAEALGKALDAPTLEDGLRIVIFKLFERELIATADRLLDQANALLSSAGILPGLGKAPDRVVEERRAPQPAPFRSAVDDAQAVPTSVADQALFASMLGMLEAWRSSVVGPASSPRQAGPAIGTHELLSILSLMQHDTQAPVAMPGLGSGSLAGQLRQHMAQSARKLGVTGDSLRLDGQDGDAVDLVALLFDVLLDGPQYDTKIRHMIGRMLVPYVKVAVKDRRLFLHKEHPARRLLNTVAEACEGNHGEAPQERELLARVDQTIDRLVAEFNEDVAIFEALEQELRDYMAQQRRRFDLTEKRSAEAQQGRERLQRARIGAAADIDRARGDRELPPVIAGFLDRHATHHLVQVALREGRDSARYRNALQAIDALLVAFDWASEGSARRELTPLPEAGLEDIFASSGCAGSAAQSAIDALHQVLARIAEGRVDAAAAIRLPEQVAVPEPAPLPPEPTPALAAANDTLDYEPDVLARTRALDVGDWLHLVGGDGRSEPAKVSWISPISSRLLLVNRRGIRVLVASPEELAAMAKLGQAQLREADTAFEDAMHQVVGRLKSAMPAG